MRLEKILRTKYHFPAWGDCCRQCSTRLDEYAAAAAVPVCDGRINEDVLYHYNVIWRLRLYVPVLFCYHVVAYDEVGGT